MRISVEGAGQLLGFGSAAPSSEESYQATAADTWDGRVMAVIRSTAQPGALRVRFVADFLPRHPGHPDRRTGAGRVRSVGMKIPR